MTNRYAIIGDIIAEQHDSRITPGGAAAIAIALAALGGSVRLRSVLATDNAGKAVLDQLRKARVHPGLIDRIDGESSSLIERNDDGKTIRRTPGIGIEKGAIMDIYDLFGHDALILDTRDQPLRRFLTDLPAHTDGNVRLVSTLNHLDWQDPTTDEIEIAMRCDAIVGTFTQFAALTGQSSASEALGDIYDQMPGTQLRAAIAVTNAGIELIAREDRVLRPVQDAIPDVLLPRVVAGVAWGLANHASWELTASVAVDPAQADA